MNITHLFENINLLLVPLALTFSLTVTCAVSAMMAAVTYIPVNMIIGVKKLFKKEKKNV